MGEQHRSQVEKTIDEIALGSKVVEGYRRVSRGLKLDFGAIVTTDVGPWEYTIDDEFIDLTAWDCACRSSNQINGGGVPSGDQYKKEKRSSESSLPCAVHVILLRFTAENEMLPVDSPESGAVSKNFG
jgi:hypothetical protein